MRWDSSTLDYFSKHNPKDSYRFWKRYKIKTFLTEVIDKECFSKNPPLLESDEETEETEETIENKDNLVEIIENQNEPLITSPDALLEKQGPRNKFYGKKRKMVEQDLTFQKIWFQERDFLILFSFLKMLNENRAKREEFFHEFLSEYFASDQAKAQEKAEEVYACISDTLSIYLDFVSRDFYDEKYVEKRTELESASIAQGSNKKCNFVVVSSRELKVKNPLCFGFEVEQILRPKVNQILAELEKSEEPTSNYKYASRTIKNLMRYGIRKENPCVAAKQVFAYIVGGFCFTLAAAAIVYLTIQTAGLIHLAWVIPTAILAIVGGASAAAGTAITLKSTPSISNRISNFFKPEKASKNPIHGELFAERRPIGMLA